MVEFGRMPILKHAIKKIRVDKRRTLVNKKIKTKVKSSVKKMRLNPSGEALKSAFSALDRAVKKRVLPGGRVNRIKARLSKLIKTEEAPKKKVSKKSK